MPLSTRATRRLGRRAAPLLVAGVLVGASAPGTPAGTRAATAGDAPPERRDVAAVRELDVRTFGARGDGVTDDTAALQRALDAGAGGVVRVPPGTYLVHADGARDGGSGGIAPRSHTRLLLAPGAVLKAMSTSSSDYIVVRIERVSNVVVEGGAIAGERETHPGRDGEWGFGIGIFGATDVTIRDVTVRDCWGDGIFVQEALPGVSVMSRNIRIERVLATNNRRQGMSVLGVEGLWVVDSIFENTSGTPPQAGVDIEPGGYGHAVRDVTFQDCVFRNNAGRGFVADATTGADIADVRVVGGRSHGNGWEGVVFHRVTGGAVLAEMDVSGNGASGVYLHDVSQVTIAGNVIAGNSQRGDAGYHGVHVRGSRAVVVRDNVIRAGSSERRQRHGVVLQGSTGVTVSGNDLRGSGRDEEIHDDRRGRNVLAGDRRGRP
jgi:hypothetical protein